MSVAHRPTEPIPGASPRKASWHALQCRRTVPDSVWHQCNVLHQHGGKWQDSLTFLYLNVFFTILLQYLAAMKQSKMIEVSLLRQSVNLLQEVCLVPVFGFCLFHFAWRVQLKVRTLGKSVYFNTANFHSMAHFTFVLECFSMLNYTVSLPATQSFSQSAVTGKRQKN